MAAQESGDRTLLILTAIGADFFLPDQQICPGQRGRLNPGACRTYREAVTDLPAFATRKRCGRDSAQAAFADYGAPDWLLRTRTPQRVAAT
jgi:hypothetical protein